MPRLRAYFLTGIVVTAPIGITIWLVSEFITFVDDRVGALLPERYHPETYLPFGLPGLGLIVMLVFFTLVGMLAAGIAGRVLVRTGERLLARTPVVRSIYGALKQIFETVLTQSSKSFREVVLIECPRFGLGLVGFVPGQTSTEIRERTTGDVVAVYVPTAPNPTAGFLLFVPRKDIMHLDMEVEEGLKLVVSAGIVSVPNGDEDDRPIVGAKPYARGRKQRAPSASGRASD